MRIQQPLSVRRGEIYYADLAPAIGSEQDGIRPVVVIQNNVGNWYSPTIIAAIITGQIKSRYLPTHVLLATSDCGLPKNSMVMLEQIRTLDRGRLQQYIGYVNAEKMSEINTALGISLGLPQEKRQS